MSNRLAMKTRQVNHKILIKRSRSEYKNTNRNKYKALTEINQNNDGSHQHGRGDQTEQDVDNLTALRARVVPDGGDDDQNDARPPSVPGPPGCRAIEPQLVLVHQTAGAAARAPAVAHEVLNLLVHDRDSLFRTADIHHYAETEMQRCQLLSYE